MSQLGVGAGLIRGELVSMECVINSATCRYWLPNRCCAGRKEGVGRKGGRTRWARRAFSCRTVSFGKQEAQYDVGSTEQEWDTPAGLAGGNEGRLVEEAGLKLATEHPIRVTKGPGERALSCTASHSRIMEEMRGMQYRDGKAARKEDDFNTCDVSGWHMRRAPTPSQDAAGGVGVR